MQTSIPFSSDLTLGRFINEEKRMDDEEWSRLIWTLINASKTAVFNRRRIGNIKVPRTSGEFFNLVFDEGTIVVEVANGEEDISFNL